ncbi:MAG: hypothetical protein HY241_13220 [Actinobacteria bacterium]|nr:hypothetical protein [Actinomycetota bacterium]
MLRALAHPVLFAGMLVGFLLAIAASAAAQVAVGRLVRDRGRVRLGSARLGPVRVGQHGAGSSRMLRRLTATLDPFGAVAALLAGPGWGALREPARGGRGGRLVALLAGPLAAVLVGVTAGVAFIAAGGSRPVLGVAGPVGLLSGMLLPDDPVQRFLIGLAAEAVAVGVLGVVPLPPLTGWRVLMLFAGRSAGWQRARYYLEEHNVGIVALLLLLIFPIGLGGPLLLELVDAAVTGVLGILA